MSNKTDKMRETIIIELDAYWSNRMTELVDEDRIEDADALYYEYVVDGEQPHHWIFIDEIEE